MAVKEYYLGSVGPFLYDDAEQEKAIVDDNDTYTKNSDYTELKSRVSELESDFSGLKLSVSKQTKSVVTAVDFDNNETTTENITFVTDVTLIK